MRSEVYSLAVAHFQKAILQEVIMCGHMPMEKRKAHPLLRYTRKLYSHQEMTTIYIWH